MGAMGIQAIYPKTTRRCPKSQPYHVPSLAGVFFVLVANMMMATNLPRHPRDREKLRTNAVTIPFFVY